MKNLINWLLDLCPFVGGIKMTIEALRGKTFLKKQELKGFGRALHLGVGVTSIFMDFTGVGGAAERGVGKVASQALAKAAEKEGIQIGEKVAEKGVEKGAAGTAGKVSPRQKFNAERFKEAGLEKARDYRGSYNKEDEREKGALDHARDVLPEYSLRQARGNIARRNQSQSSEADEKNQRT